MDLELSDKNSKMPRICSAHLIYNLQIEKRQFIRSFLRFLPVYFPVFSRQIPAIILLKTEKYPRKKLSNLTRAKLRQALKLC